LCRIPWAKRAGCSSYGQIREDSKSSAAFFAGSTEVVSASFFPSLPEKDVSITGSDYTHLGDGHCTG